MGVGAVCLVVAAAPAAAAGGGGVQRVRPRLKTPAVPRPAASDESTSRLYNLSGNVSTVTSCWGINLVNDGEFICT